MNTGPYPRLTRRCPVWGCDARITLNDVVCGAHPVKLTEHQRQRIAYAIIDHNCAILSVDMMDLVIAEVYAEALGRN